jgi:hypothetical protein
MKSQFVPYDIAVKLKEVGFHENCFGWWQGKKICSYTGSGEEVKGYKLKAHILAPTYQQAIDWFRQNKGITLEINIDKKRNAYYFGVYSASGDVSFANEADDYYTTLNKGIKYILSNNLC